MRFFPENLLTNGDMSGNLTSTNLSLLQVFGFSIQAVWTGTPTGTLQLNCSNDGVNWDMVQNSAQSLTGSAGHFTWNVTSSNYRWVQLTYTATSGSGSLTVNAFCRGF